MLPTETQITDLTLRQLSIIAAQIWHELEATEDEEQVAALVQSVMQIQEATEEKVDALNYVAHIMQTDIEAWTFRLKEIQALYSSLVEQKKKRLDYLKAGLLRLHAQGLIPDKLLGHDRAIEIRDNPPKLHLLKDPAESDFPEQFREQTVVTKAKTDEILTAYKAGTDVSAFAQVTQGKHVRFKNKPIRAK
jgi:hypothetical protein